jgi:LemA protein
MKKSTWIWIAVGVVVLLILFSLVGYYNSFVGLNQNVQSSWSEVENQYQRQADLIPNFVSVVSSAVRTEIKFVKEVTEARTAWQSATTALAKDTAGQQMNTGLTAFVNAVAENYPLLQSIKQYSALTDELSGTQNRITVARGRYIESVQTLNTAVSRFPGNIIAGIFGFSKVEYYTAAAGTTTQSLGSGTLP